MVLYQCDYVPRAYERCPEEAMMAFERDEGFGQEMRHFCRHHLPAGWDAYERVYRIVEDTLIEVGITKQRREPVAVTIGVPVPRETIREAVRKHWEHKHDVLIMHSLGVKYE